MDEKLNRREFVKGAAEAPLPAELIPLFGERWRHIDKQVRSCYHTAL